MYIYLIGNIINEDGNNPIRTRYAREEISLEKAREIARGLLFDVDSGYSVIVDGDYQEIIGEERDYGDEVDLMIEKIDEEYNKILTYKNE